MKYISGNGNNQAGGNITILSNLVHDVKVQPREIELKAIVNHDLVLLFVYIVSIVSVYVLLSTFIVSTTFTILASTGTGVFVIFLIDGAQKFMMKYSSWHIKYVDGRITINGRERKFYEEIWSMSYKKTLIGNGIISFYAVNPDSNMPYSRKIKFMNDAEAKYVYDSFMDGERMKRYRESMMYSAPA